MEKMPGVEDVEGRRIIEIRARRGAENWQNLTLVGVSDFAGNISIFSTRLKALNFPVKMKSSSARI